MEVVRRSKNPSTEARVLRRPDVFLSHSARDKTRVRKLAEDLAFCEVDTWLDEWEIHIGESLHDAIAGALEASRFVAIVIAENFSDSRWASDEMKQALARERRENRTVVIPIMFADRPVPAFLEDKLYVDLRSNYFAGVTRLAALVHDIPRQHIEDAVRSVAPDSISGAIQALRFAGFEPYVVMSEDDALAVLRSGGVRSTENKIRFDPQAVAANPTVSPRLRRMMHRLSADVWK